MGIGESGSGIWDGERICAEEWRSGLRRRYRRDEPPLPLGEGWGEGTSGFAEWGSAESAKPQAAGLRRFVARDLFERQDQRRGRALARLAAKLDPAAVRGRELLGAREAH